MTLSPHPPHVLQTADRRLSSAVSSQQVALRTHNDNDMKECERLTRRRKASGEETALLSSSGGRHAFLRRAKSTSVLIQTIPNQSTRRKLSTPSSSALPVLWQRKLRHSMPTEEGHISKRYSLTFEEWSRIAENRRKLNEMQTLIEKREENKRIEIEKRNRFKRRISFEEWLLEKTSNEINSDTNHKNSLGTTSDEVSASSPLQKQASHPQSATSSESNKEKLTKQATITESSHGEDQRLKIAKIAFKKWLIKKELAALSRERQKLLKSRTVFCDSLKVISTTA